MIKLGRLLCPKSSPRYCFFGYGLSIKDVCSWCFFWCFFKRLYVCSCPFWSAIITTAWVCNRVYFGDKKCGAWYCRVRIKVKMSSRISWLSFPFLFLFLPFVRFFILSSLFFSYLCIRLTRGVLLSCCRVCCLLAIKKECVRARTNIILTASELTEIHIRRIKFQSEKWKNTF